MSTFLNDLLQTKLKELKEKGLYNEVDVLESPTGPLIFIKGREYINLSSNNYLGLATDERLKVAAIEATKKWGVGAGAVRSINGTLKIHEDLEEHLASFKDCEAALVFQSGFNCNMAVIPALMGKNDLILSDELNHASIIDGCRLSQAKVVRVAHSNMSHLRKAAKEARESALYENIMFISDGVFSMDGDLCLLDEIVKIAKEFNLITYIDDAHGSGVMGGGAGTVKSFSLSREVDVQMGTLSKAVGAIGGYVAGSKVLIDYLKVTSRPFLFSTALSPSSAAAAIEAIKIMREDSSLHDRLWQRANYLKNGLKNLGFNIGESQTPITPCIIGDENLAQKFSKELMREGVYVKSITYPTVPLGKARVRNMPTANHTIELLDKVLEIYKKVGSNLKII